MVFRQLYDIDNSGQLLISLPDSFRQKKQVMVLLDDSFVSKSEKIKLMKMASSDELLKQDIESVLEDF